MTLAVLAALSPSQSNRQDGFSWPQWGGPRRDALSLEEDWLSAGRSVPLWKAEVGLGYSGFAVVDGRLYTMGFDKEMGLDLVSCLDARTGEPLWDFIYEAQILRFLAPSEGHRGGTNSTPSVAGGFVHTLGREGSLHCLDAVMGGLRLQQNYVEEYALEVPTWGFAASPLVLSEVAIVNMGKVLGLEKTTGEVLWSSRDYGHSYSTPTDFEYGNRPALAVFNASGLAVLDTRDGSEIAFRGWRTRFDINAASPLVFDERIYISSGQGRGNAMLQLTEDGLETVWENRSMGNKMSGCVRIGDHLYGCHEAVLRCMDLDGAVRWSERGLGYGALMGAGNRLIVLDDEGHLLVLEASPERFQLLSRAKVLDGGVYWTRPTLVDGRIYCRNSLGSVVCRDHRTSSKGAVASDR